MTRNVSCAPCAKRKVRCDRKEPCSNCKRRKNDHCVYPVTTTNARVRQFETVGTKYRYSPEHTEDVTPRQVRGSPTASQVQPLDNRSQNENASPFPGDDPLIVRDRGSIVYLESYVNSFLYQISERNFLLRILDPRGVVGTKEAAQTKIIPRHRRIRLILPPMLLRVSSIARMTWT